MPTHYTLRMQFGPHEDPPEITTQLLQLIDESAADEIMLFFFAEEQNDGHDPLERVKEWIDRSRPYRQALQQAGIAVSLNPWHSLLHCDRGRRLKPGQDWQRMVDPNGREADAVVCPLDPNWQAYYLETLRLYAREGFRVVWIDDDIRYHNHEPLEWGGCFCHKHVAQFNRRTGAQATRSQIVAACLAPGEPHPWRAIWMDLWQESLLAFLAKCRQTLEAGGTKMGLMSSSMEAHSAEGRRWAEWWQVFSGENLPIHRPHFWTYSDAGSTMLIHGIASLDQNRSIQPAGLETGPEIENFPYGQWNKSYRQTFAQMAVAQIGGSTNLNISLYDFMGNRPDDDPGRAKFLRQVRPNLDWLADQFPMSLCSVGVGLPWSQDQGRAVHTPAGDSWFELQPPSRGWAYWLGAAGVAFSMLQQSTVNALAGPAAWSFSEKELECWLAAGLLLDGEAASILVQRGLGGWMGLSEFRPVHQNQMLYSMETCRDPRFALRTGGQISVNAKTHTRVIYQAESPTAQSISELVDPLQRVVGHGVLIYENEAGGRVVVVPWSASTTPTMDIHRAVQIRRLVDWLAHGNSTGSVEGSAWLVPQFYTHGKTWRGVLWNAGPDDVNTLRVRRPQGMPPVKQAWQINWSGARQPVTVDNDTIGLNHPLNQWDLLVLNA